MKRVLLLILSFAVNTSAMESDLPVFSIIDENKGNHLTVKPDTIVSVFGATPQYILFKQFQETLESHAKKYNSLNNKLPGVNRKKKSVARFLKQNFASIQKFTDTESDDLYELFLRVGLDGDRLLDNVKSLVARHGEIVAQEPNKSHVLIHQMFPSYFANLAEAESKPDMAVIKSFVEASARHYKSLYQEVLPEDNAARVCIMIPPINTFERVIKEGETSLEAGIVDPLKGAVVQHLGADNTLLLINQNREENQKLCNALQKTTSAHVIPKYLSIKNELGFDTTVFTPYRLGLRGGRSYKKEYGDSPILIPELQDELQNTLGIE